MVKLDEFISSLKTSLPSITVCAGEETFFKEQALKFLIEAIKAVDPKLTVINFELNHGEKGPAAGTRLLSDLCTPSLFSGARLYVIRNEKDILSSSAKAMADYITGKKKLPNWAVFFAKKLDGRTAFAKNLKKRGALVECKKLFSSPAPWQRGNIEETELSRWTSNRAKQKGFKLTSKAALFLTSQVGEDLFLVDTELEKLTLVREWGDRMVDVADVEKSTGMSAVHTPFDLWDKIESGKLSEAVDILSVILHNGLRSTGGKLENDSAAIAAILLSMFRERIRLSAQVALLVWERCEDREIMQTVGIGSAFYLKKLKETGVKLKASTLKKVNETLLNGEKRIKRYGHGPVAVMEETVIKLARAGI